MTFAESAAAYMHPDDAPSALQTIHEAMAAVQPFSVEYRLRSAEGQWRWCLGRGEPAVDPQTGKVLQWIGVSVDIHGTKVAADALKATAHRQAYVVRLNDALSALYDPLELQSAAVRLLGEQLRASRALYAEYEDALRQGVIRCDYWAADLESIAGDYQMADFGQVHAHLRSGQTVLIADVCAAAEFGPAERKALAALQITSLLGVPLVKRGQLVASLFVTDQRPRVWSELDQWMVHETADRTWAAVERSRAERALRQADRKKDQFLATLAHELRNPLAPLRNGIQIARLSLPADSKVQATLSMMDRQMVHLVRLVDDLLDVGRISSGKLVLRRKPLDLRGVLASSMESVQGMFDAREQLVELELLEDELPVDGDFDRLTQVFINLLTNASKYTESGGRITLSMAREEQEAVVRVTDTGIGIPREALPEVFELFSQVRAHQSRAQGGLGIGLSLVRTIVGLHGGSVTATSEGLDQGSTFTVRLPLLGRD